MDAFVAFIGSCFSSFWNCLTGLFSSQGGANESGMASGAPTGVLGSGISLGELAGLGLGAAMLINPTGTGHLIGKVGSSAAGAISDTVSTAVDGVSSIMNDLVKQPWVWVAGGVLLLILLKD